MKSSDSMERRALAIVPARGGSKRLPRKNLLELGGKPLVAHTLDAAVASGCFSEVRLSSDDEEILEVGARPGVTPMLREAKWASDTATIFDFLKTVAAESTDFDIISLLLPTAPFRGENIIREAFKLLTDDVDAVVSFRRFDTPPQFAVTLGEEDGIMRPVFDSSPLITGKTRSQDQAPMLHPNGAIYLSWWRSYQRFGSFYAGRTRGYEMSAEESVDIDRMDDLLYARMLFERRETSAPTQ